VAGPAAAVELPKYYYRDNFVSLCDTVQTQYGDLLSADECEFLARFYMLDHPAQCLYVRLVSRVGPLFRTAKLDYPELGDLDVSVRDLIDSGLAARINTLTVSDLGGIFTKAELACSFRDDLNLPAQYRKEHLLEGIEGLQLEPSEYFSRITLPDEPPVVGIVGTELIERLQLLFFGNSYQSLTEFILSDLGLARYYPYPLDRDHRLFPNRDALDEYIACGEFSKVFRELAELDDTDALVALAGEMLVQHVEHESSRRRWQRGCIRVGRELERRGELELALGLYGRCDLHPARERSARILESRKDWPAVIRLCEEMQCEPRCEAELEAAGRIQTRALRNSGEKSAPRSRDCFTELHLKIPSQSGSVERDVAAHLAANWNRVDFVENSLMNTLFGLAFWEQIFLGVSGAFHNPYQSAPTDMYEGAFTRRRQAEIDRRLKTLRDADIPEELANCRARFENYRCRWTDWQLVSTELQNHAVQIIPREHLLAIWERQLFDPGENRNGFPDLIALGETPGNYCMIEVKGPGDRLQDNQKRWLRYFANNGIPASVAWVEWSDG
jgi:hypothetical protein